MLQEPQLKPEVHSGAQEGLEVPAPVVTPLVLLLYDRTSSDIENMVHTSMHKNEGPGWLSELGSLIT